MNISFNQPLSFIPQSLQTKQDKPAGVRASFITEALALFKDINVNAETRARFPAWTNFQSKDTYTRGIYVYLLRVGGRVLYTMYTQGGFPTDLTLEQLEEFFSEVVYSKADVQHNQEENVDASSRTLTDFDVERLCRNAALKVKERNTMAYAERYRVQQARRGRTVGLSTRRKPTYTVDDLEPQGDRSKTAWVKAEAARLGCSERTVWSLTKKTEAAAMPEEVLTEPEAVDPIVEATLTTLEWDIYSYVDQIEEENRKRAVPELTKLLDSMDW
jgi:hypothetical protein